MYSFGQSGPYASRPGYDFVAEAMGGFMSITGDPNGPPTRAGVAIADVSTGMYAAVSVLVANGAPPATLSQLHALLDDVSHGGGAPQAILAQLAAAGGGILVVQLHTDGGRTTAGELQLRLRLAGRRVQHAVA